MNFNSIKVQLKRIWSPTCTITSKFQFHKGTIKTNSLHSRPRQSAFQFHKGTIKTLINSSNISKFDYFNSIKVQLKPSSGSVGDGSPSFQFHKGTIKTRIADKGNYKIVEFQFHKGTIKTRYSSSIAQPCYISIP